MWLSSATRISSVLVAAAAFYLFTKGRLFGELKSIKAVFKPAELLAFSLPLTVSNMVVIFRKRFDILIIGFFLPAEQVGAYGAAFAIAVLPKFFQYSLNRILLPVASKLYADNNMTDLNVIYKKVAKLAVVVTMPIFFSILAYPNVFLQILFADKFDSAGPVLQILVVGVTVNVLTGSFGEILQSFGHTKAVMWISITGTCSNLAMMMVLVPVYGITGAAISMTASLVLMALLGLIILWRLKSMHPFNRDYFIVIAAGAASLVLLLLFNMCFEHKYYVSVLLATAITVAYFALLTKTGILGSEDIALLARRRSADITNVQLENNNGSERTSGL